MQVPELDSSHGQSNSRHVGKTLILICYIPLSEEDERFITPGFISSKERESKDHDKTKEEGGAVLERRTLLAVPLFCQSPLKIHVQCL